MTLEKQLERAKKKLATLDAQLNRPDSEAYYFPLGVGFKKGRQAKAAARNLDRTIDRSVEWVRLSNLVASLTARLEADSADYKAQQRAVEASVYYVSPDEMTIGQRVNDSSFGWCEVIKINRKTVTIRARGGYTEARAPHLIYRPKPLPLSPPPPSPDPLADQKLKVKIALLLERQQQRLR